MIFVEKLSHMIWIFLHMNVISGSLGLEKFCRGLVTRGLVTRCWFVLAD